MSNNPNFPHFSGNQGQANPPRYSRDNHNHMKSNLYAQPINLHPNENFSPPHNESFASSNYSLQSGRAKKKIFEPLGPPEQINLSYRSEINHQPSLSLHTTRSTPQNNAQSFYPDNFQNTQPLSSKLPQASPRTHHHNLSIPNYYSERPELQHNYGNQNPYMNQNNLHPQMIYENRSTTPTRSPIRNKHVPQDLNINLPPSPNSQFQNQDHLPPSPHSQFNNLNYPQKSPHAQHNKNFIPEEDFHSTRPQPQPHPQNQSYPPHPNQQFQFPDNNNYVNAVDFDGMSMISGTSSRRRTKPIVILNINVGNGQTDELKLFDGENPEEVVNSFCMKYNLPAHIQPVLLQNLSLQASRFYEVRAQKLQQRMLNRTQPNILEEDQSLMAQANNLQSQRAHTETAVDYYSGERQPPGYGNGRKNSYVDMNEPQRSNRQQQQQKPTTPRSGGQGYQSNQGGVVPPSDRNRERNASRSPIGYQDNQYQQQYEEPQQKQYREPKQQQQQYRGPQQQQYREPPQQQSYREPKHQQQQQYREPPQQHREPPQKQRSQRNIPNKQETRSWNQLDESEIDGSGNDYDEGRSQASSTPSTQVFDKLYEQGMRNKERKELMRDDLQKQMNSKEQKELTFQPQINKNTRAIIPKRQSRIEDELWKDAEQRRERQAKAQLLKEKLEMEGFTGTPKINTGKRPTQPRATQSKSPVHSSHRLDDYPPPARKQERVKNPAIENNNKFVPTINRKSNAMAEKNRNNNMAQDNIHQNLYEDGLRKRKSINQISDERPSFDPKTNQELFKPKINKSNPYYQKAANKRDSTFVVEEIAVDQDQLDEAIATRSTRSIRPSYNQNRESKSVGPITSSGKKSTTPKAMPKQNISKDDSFSHYDERDNYYEPSSYVQPSNSSNKKIKEEELSVGSFHSNKKASIFVSEPEREKLIEIFQALDDNHDGIITVQDIDVSNLDPNVIEAISDVLFALEGVSMMTFDDFAKAVYDMKVIVALREIYGLPAAENPYQSNKIAFSVINFLLNY